MRAYLNITSPWENISHCSQLDQRLYQGWLGMVYLKSPLP